MNNTWYKKAGILLALLLLTAAPSWAQEVTGVRGAVYDAYTRISPIFTTFAGGMGMIAGLGSLIYVFTRVYQMLMLEHHFDVTPILKPFGLGLLLLFYSGLLGIMNGMMAIPINATQAMVETSEAEVERLVRREVNETQGWKWYMGSSNRGDYDTWVKDNAIDEGFGISSRIQFEGERMEFIAKQLIRDFVYVVSSSLFFAASLAIDTARLFFLIVLGLLGPFAIALSIFDLFSGSLAQWMTRYIHVSLWLPVANIYGYLINEIQVSMVSSAIIELNADGSSTFSTSDMSMIVFLIFASIGYMTIPSVASWIVAPGHQGAAAMQQVNAVGNTISAAAGAATAGAVAAVTFNEQQKQHENKLQN